MTTINPHAPSVDDAVIEIKLWEIYLLYHPAKLYQILTDYSLDNGPLDNYSQKGRIIFRFKFSNWESYIKHLLYHHRIPVIIQSDYHKAVRVKGREALAR